MCFAVIKMIDSVISSSILLLYIYIYIYIYRSSSSSKISLYLVTILGSTNLSTRIFPSEVVIKKKKKS